MALWDYSSWVGVRERPYGDEVTYELGMTWLDEVCDDVEDWGSGLSYAKRFVTRARYVGIDGSPSASHWADRIDDLRDYTSDVDGIFMRHVLEHNDQWRLILANAISSFRKRFVLIMFTPFGERTMPMANNAKLDISFNRDDLMWFFYRPDLRVVREQYLKTNTQYDGETVFFIERRQVAEDEAVQVNWAGHTPEGEPIKVVEPVDVSSGEDGGRVRRVPGLVPA